MARDANAAALVHANPSIVNFLTSKTPHAPSCWPPPDCTMRDPDGVVTWAEKRGIEDSIIVNNWLVIELKQGWSLVHLEFQTVILIPSEIELWRIEIDVEIVVGGSVWIIIKSGNQEVLKWINKCIWYFNARITWNNNIESCQSRNQCNLLILCNCFRKLISWRIQPLWR